jgi:hypothetical protein
MRGHQKGSIVAIGTVVAPTEEDLQRRRFSTLDVGVFSRHSRDSNESTMETR